MINIYEIIKRFNLKLVGKISDPIIHNVNSLNNQKSGGLCWVKEKKYLKKISTGIFVVSHKLDLPKKNNIAFLVTNENPKIIFSKILREYFIKPRNYYFKSDILTHKQNPEIIIGENVFIGQNVSIGKGTIIHHNVVIEADSIIGCNCIIKSHVSLGTEGLGFEYENDKLVKFPQLGNIIIGDYVEIGPNSTIRRASIDSTIIGSGSKIGSLVNIGHNSEIGENCILTSNVILGGSSKIGNNVYLGIGTVTKNGSIIGDNSLIGMGSIVTKDISSDVIAYGFPAKIIKHKSNPKDISS